MELIIGGAYQGKKNIAQKLFGLRNTDILDGENCKIEDAFSCRAVSEFHMLIRRIMEQQESPEDFFKHLKTENPGVILISNEIGYGIVPLERFERDWREKTGRICCLAAQESGHVIRVLAGNPVCIKGEQIW